MVFTRQENPNGYVVGSDMLKDNAFKDEINNYCFSCVIAISTAAKDTGVDMNNIKNLDIMREHAKATADATQQVDNKNPKALLDVSLQRVSALEDVLKKICRDAGFPIENYTRPEMPNGIKAIHTMPLISDIDPTRADAANREQGRKL